MQCRNEKRRGNRKEEGRKTVLKQYGLTLDDYDEMLEEQGNSCAICDVHISALPTNLHVDHCHTTGKVRGLLCNKCNAGLGMYNDNPELLYTAIKYLENV